MELINKSAIVAEIKRIEEQNPHIQHGDMLVNRDRSIRCNLLEDLLAFINTLETKEVNLDRAIDKWIDDAAITHEDCSITDVISTAKHFFELGIKTKKGE